MMRSDVDIGNVKLGGSTTIEIVEPMAQRKVKFLTTVVYRFRFVHLFKRNHMFERDLSYMSLLK
jgi:hypothetical protein